MTQYKMFVAARCDDAHGNGNVLTPVDEEGWQSVEADSPKEAVEKTKQEFTHRQLMEMSNVPVYEEPSEDEPNTVFLVPLPLEHYHVFLWMQDDVDQFSTEKIEGYDFNSWQGMAELFASEM